jgi:hypothetical protein
MKLLLIRPEDALLDGPWVGPGWDRIIDLGRGGISVYEQATARYARPVGFLDELRDGYKEIYRTRELLRLGMGKLTDRLGLDWWELTRLEIHQQLETIILLQKLARSIGPKDDVHVSGPGFHAGVLRLILGRRIEIFPSRERPRGAEHYFRTFQKFPLSQLLEIFWDKTDPSYQVRAYLSRRPKPRKGEIVLLPTAYINVSRTGIAYARSLPEVQFLMVSTRRSGWITDLPANVSAEWLRSYASVRSRETKCESQELMARWVALRKELEDVAEFRAISECGYFDKFPYHFGRGLEIRDAWRNVFNSESVGAVLCADDSNAYTHIPLLLAKKKGIRTISCHHGALDGRYMIKRPHADFILAKGKMEADYLTRLCEVPADRVVIGAPSIARAKREWPHVDSRRLVVFFSEPYEATGGRAADVYKDLLPRLSDLVAKEGRELMVKLHPAESVTERRAIIDRILSPEQARNVILTKELLGPQLLDSTWFGITVLSTVVLECALRQVPCFLCKWLESSPYGYVDQFTRFGLGVRLNHPTEIDKIPVLLRSTEAQPQYGNYWQEIDKSQLRILLSPSQQMQSATHATGPGMA